MKKRIAAVLASALFTAIPVQAQSLPNRLGGTAVLTMAQSGPDCDQDQYTLTGTVSGSIGKGTAILGCHDNHQYAPLQSTDNYVDPTLRRCYAILTSMSVTTDKFPNGIDFDIAGTTCDGTTIPEDPPGARIRVRIPVKEFGSFNGHGVPDRWYWGTFSIVPGRHDTRIMKFDGYLSE